jgi:hypothetical protein
MTQGHTPAGWYADPFGRFPFRYWDGTTWTQYVSADGQQYTDAPVPSPAPPTVPPVPTTVGPAPVTPAHPAVAWVPARITAVIGAAILVLGSVLPWAEVRIFGFSKSVNGIDGDGKITILLGLGCIALLVAAARSAGGRWTAVVLAVLAAVASGYDLVNLADAVSGIPDNLAADASIGFGLYLCVGGAVVASIAGLAYAARSS